MRLFLQFKALLQKLSPTLVSELAQLVERLNAWAGVEHLGTGRHGAVTVTSLTFASGSQQTTVGSAGGASALPATPTGYQTLTLPDGTDVVFPYYDKS